MDMPVKVPVDDPNADTEWYVVDMPVGWKRVLPVIQERHIATAWNYSGETTISHSNNRRGSRGGPQVGAREQT